MKDLNRNPPKKREYFSNRYDSKERWISYWYQIAEIQKIKPSNILEIGIGNGTVARYLKDKGFDVTTCDIDKYLKPDHICNVTELTNTFKKKQFDCILCSEVLEHIPFDSFEKSLQEIREITKKHAIISLPYHSFKLKISLKISPFKERVFSLAVPFPTKHKFDGYHFWEVGKVGHSLKKVLGIMSKYFIIEKYFLVPEHQEHMFFILRKK